MVETLDSYLEQEIEFISSRRCNIAAFIPYIYYHNAAGAVFKFEIIKGASVIFQQTFTSLDIVDSVGGVYAHVFYPIIPVNPVQIQSGVYKFRIAPVSGYTPGNTFIGWIKQFEDTQNKMSYIPTDDSQLTYAIRFKEYTEGILL